MRKFTIRLNGCRTRPLASYLKSIGTLRAVSRHDRSAKGWWKDDVFFLSSSLSNSELSKFFLTEYSPTPLISPWNGGSGFYPKDQKRGFDAIAASKAQRFADYREAISAGRELTAGRDASPKNEEKEEMLLRAAKQWRGPLAEWLSAALVIDAEGSPVYPALLGTGGNDGRLDFTNNFMQRLAQLFDLDAAEAPATPIAVDHLREALFDDAIMGMQNVAIGQFDPGAAGGANNSVGFATIASVNLWDYVLMLEGTIAFSPALVRRSSADGLKVMKNPQAGLPLAAAPFAVSSAGAGYATAVGEEKNHGEQWMPIWNRPTTYGELTAMLSQARCRVRSKPAKRPRDIAHAIARAGVSRGFTAFQRYGFLERNGRSKLATPLGLWEVGSNSPRAYLLDEIDDWVDRFERAANGKTVPESWAKHSRLIDEAIMNCCRPGVTSAAWADLAVALGRAELTIIRNPGAAAKSFMRPLYYGQRGLRPEWIVAMADRSTSNRAAEIRLAVALASQGGQLRTQDRSFRVDRSDPIRRHFIPLASTGRRISLPHRFAASEDRLVISNDVVVNDLNLNRDLAELVYRRLLMLQSRNDLHFFPLVPTTGFEACLADIARWIDGTLDQQRIASLARMLSAVDWDAAWRKRTELRAALGTQDFASEWQMVRQYTGWAITRLCFHWTEVWIDSSTDPERERRATRHKVASDPVVFARLVAGDGRAAVQLARERLLGSGIRARLSSVIAPSNQVRRWASSIAWSLSAQSINRLAQTVFNLASIAQDSDVDVQEPVST